MQGRLLPKVKNRYQCFPGKNWAKEFYLAKKLKLDLIELIFDIYEYKINPLYNLEELKKLKNNKKNKYQSQNRLRRLFYE